MDDYSNKSTTGHVLDFWLRAAGKLVLGIAVAVIASIITALITGQPLTGLLKLKGLYKTFILSSVSAWIFTVVLLFALFAFLYAIKHLPKRRPKGKVHFLRDVLNTGWSKQHDTEMNVRLGGTFTYDGPGELTLLTAFLDGTELPPYLSVQVPAPDGSGLMSTDQIWLHEGFAHRVLIDLRLTPVLGVPGNSLRKEVIFRDKFDRNFSIGKVEFPYIGRTR